MNSPAPAASAYFRSWRDLEALIATKGWGVRASPAIGDGADVLYFVPPPGDTPTCQVRHLGKALQASVWALRGSAGSMLSLDPVTAAQVEARPHQWRVEAMVPDHPQFPTRDSFTLVCGDVLVGLGLMAPPDPVQDALADALADAGAPPPETAVEALQRRVDRMAQLDPAFTVHDAGYSPDDFATTDDMVHAAALMDELDAADAVTDDRARATLDRHGFSPDDFDTWDTVLACAQAFDAMTEREAAAFAAALQGLDPITADNVTARASASFASLHPPLGEAGPDDFTDAEVMAAMDMPHDAPGRDERMAQVFGDDRRNWPGDPADVDGVAVIGVDLGSGSDMTAYAYRSTTDGQVKAWDGSPPYPADHPLHERVAQLHQRHSRDAFAAALMAAKRKPPAWRRFCYASAQLWRAAGRRLQRGL